MRPTAGVPIPERNWNPVVVEVVDLVPGSIPERVQYASMEDWRLDCPWCLVLTRNPVKRSASLLSLHHVSNDCTNDVKSLEPKMSNGVCGKVNWCSQKQHRGGGGKGKLLGDKGLRGERGGRISTGKGGKKDLSEEKGEDLRGERP